jgi:hypothetical protein
LQHTRWVSLVLIYQPKFSQNITPKLDRTFNEILCYSPSTKYFPPTLKALLLLSHYTRWDSKSSTQALACLTPIFLYYCYWTSCIPPKFQHSNLIYYKAWSNFWQQKFKILYSFVTTTWYPITLICTHTHPLC